MPTRQITEAELYEILGRAYVSWQLASRDRSAYEMAATQNFKVAEALKARVAELEAKAAATEEQQPTE